MEKFLRTKLVGGGFVGVDPERSRLMGRVRSRGNRSTEKVFRSALVRAGICGWILHPKEVFGTPDFYFSRAMLAVFVDGCFWHGCKKCGHIPKTRSSFWRAKFERNKARRTLVRARLNDAGIKVIRFWEHQLDAEPKKAVRKIEEFLKLRRDLCR